MSLFLAGLLSDVGRLASYVVDDQNLYSHSICVCLIFFVECAFAMGVLGFAYNNTPRTIFMLELAIFKIDYELSEFLYFEFERYLILKAPCAESTIQLCVCLICLYIVARYCRA